MGREREKKKKKKIHTHDRAKTKMIGRSGVGKTVLETGLCMYRGVEQQELTTIHFN